MSSRRLANIQIGRNFGGQIILYWCYKSRTTYSNDAWLSFTNNHQTLLSLSAFSKRILKEKKSRNPYTNATWRSKYKLSVKSRGKMVKSQHGNLKRNHFGCLSRRLHRMIAQSTEQSLKQCGLFLPGAVPRNLDQRCLNNC